jgi:hypothetical protein
MYAGESLSQEQSRFDNTVGCFRLPYLLTAIDTDLPVFEQPGLVQLTVDPYQQVRKIRRARRERKPQKGCVAPSKHQPLAYGDIGVYVGVTHHQSFISVP